MFGGTILLVLFVRTLLWAPTYNNPVVQTKIKMYSIAEALFHFMEIDDQTNIMEYVHSITGEPRELKVLDQKILREILLAKNIKKLSSSREEHYNDLFRDAWKQPIIISLTTNQNAEVGITMHSFGKNKRNDNGGGDDIFLWFDADMYNSELQGSAYSKRIFLLKKIGINNPSQKQIDDFIPPYFFNNGLLHE